MNKENKNDLTQGVVWKQVLMFFVPVVIGSFFQHLYTIVDTIVVGKGLGTDELAGVGGSASKLVVMITNFFIGVSSGITAYTSRYYGEKNYGDLKNIIYNGIAMFSVMGLLLSAFGIAFSNEFLLVMNTPESTFVYANTYLKTYLTGMIFCVVYNTLAGILRALGDSKRPLYVLVFCSFLNITLDVLLALVMGLGVFGVALATVIAQGCSAFLLIAILMKTLENTGPYSRKIDVSAMKNIAKIGIPAGCQSMMFSLSNMAVQSGVNTFSAVSVAGWTAYVKIDSIADIFVSALGGTVIPFVGQNIGAKQFDRVRLAVKQIMIISYCVVSVVVAVFILNRTLLISLFTDDLAVIEIGSKLMLLILPMYLLTIPQQVFSQALRGMGKSFVPMIMTLVGVVGLRLFWVYFVLPVNPSLELLALCYPLSAFLMSSVFAVYYGVEIRKLGR